MQVQYFGSVRAAAQKAEERAALSGQISVLELLRRLAGFYGAAFSGEVFAGEALRDDLSVAVNGVTMRHAAAEETFLRPGDVLALFPLFPGGG